MKQFFQDLSLMPDFYRCKRQGKIWLEPMQDGSTICKSLTTQTDSNELKCASEAYLRLTSLLGGYFHVACALLMGAGALLIVRVAQI